MPSNPDYRLYLEEKFSDIDKTFASLSKEIEKNSEVQNKLINAQFLAVNDKLEEINTHVQRTNNRVTHLEDCTDLLNKESENRKIAVTDFYALRGKIIAIKKNWIWLIIGFIVAVVLIGVVMDVFGTKFILREVWEKIP